MKETLKIAIETALSSKFGSTVRISKERGIGGGCINEAACISTTEGDFFVKWNDAKKFPSMFYTELKGLKLLKDAQAIKIPDVILQSQVEGISFLILEFVSSASMKPDFWEEFGRSLAQLHRQSHSEFGLDHDNYIGSLLQFNEPKSSWTEFFIEMRLEKQIQLALDSGKISNAHLKMFDSLFNQFQNLMPDEKPALLHGDLWSGNYMVDENGTPCIFDPAIYFGHREMDLAMTALFGGFDAKLYESYNEAFPLTPGFNERFDICNLYPLMVHVNLFGSGYLGSVERILDRFG